MLAVGHVGGSGLRSPLRGLFARPALKGGGAAVWVVLAGARRQRILLRLWCSAERWLGLVQLMVVLLVFLLFFCVVVVVVQVGLMYVGVGEISDSLLGSALTSLLGSA